jgi:uncharacterized membrane protein
MAGRDDRDGGMTKSHASVRSLPAEGEEDIGLERLMFFSDAVFAIAITLLALEIRLPTAEGALTDDELLTQLLSLWPKYLAYVISFLVIGTFWLGHHRRFRYIRRYDRRLLWFNLLALMCIAFIPFPTGVISESGSRTATIFYALTMTVTGLLSGVIWWYAAWRDRLIDPALDRKHRRYERVAPLVIPAIFLLSIGLAFSDAQLAKYSWSLTLPAAWLIR